MADACPRRFVRGNNKEVSSSAHTHWKFRDAREEWSTYGVCSSNSYICYMAATQLSPPRAFPEGFRYKEGILSLDEEQALINEFAHLRFKEFEFRGFLGRRRTVSFGWRYDFNVRELQETEEIPTFLLGLREAVAQFAGLQWVDSSTRS